MAKQEKFKHWCIIELFGNQRIAGMVTEAKIAGKSYIQVDVPPGRDNKPFTRYYNHNAVYSLEPVTQEFVLASLAKIYPPPVIEIDPFEENPFDKD